jgi:mannonate dehydratase
LRYIENYKTSVRNIGAAGIEVVCYNLMPVVDWTRTNLMYRLPSASHALRFEMKDFAAYDVYLLQREGAEADYPAALLAAAEARFEAMSGAERTLLEKNIIAGLPGGEGSCDREGIRNAIAEFIALGTAGFRANLFAFLREIVPVAEQAGVRLCIHPDDPPFSLFGLPRVASTAADARAILDEVPSVSNGLTLCAGSFGARGDNDMAGLVEVRGVMHALEVMRRRR